MKKTALFALVAGIATFARADANSPWAMCTCEEPSPLPAGTSWAGGELSFTNRAANGGASFDFSALDSTTFTGATIRFADGEIAVDTLKFDPEYALRFVGGNGTVLKGTADKSVFDGLVAPLPFFAARLSAPGPQLTVWSNLTFTCDAEVRPVWRNGGAIAIDAGGFVLDGCTFTDCFAEEFGGAVYAPLLVFDSMITNCVFDGSWVSAWNGYGGAIYVSAIHDGCTISVIDSRFTGNDAVNGGAICTVRAADDQEVPIRLDIVDSGFDGNTADYGGGAVFAEGAVTTAGSNTVFASNSAGYLGGAICVNGIDGISVPVGVVIGSGAVFTDNVASNSHTWTAGGAIAVSTEGCTIDIAGALFATNRAVSAFAGGTALGGAVYAGDGCTNRFYGTRFIGNGVRAGGSACYGGALSLSTGRQRIDTCVFDCRTPESDVNLYGGAVDFDVSDDALVRNCTFRHAEVEAVSAYAIGSVAVSNCVIVGNGTISAEYPDVFFEMCESIALAYTAYGSIYTDTELAVDDFNLSGRQTDIYANDSLRLRATGFNPVAALGLEQPGVSDIDGVPYGSLPCGTSMGAYETPTEPLRVTLDGSKNYDGNATSNGCEWTWKLSCTNGEETAWTDLVDPADDLRNELRKVFSVTNWAFGDFNVGYYASTNATESTRIVAGVAGADERVEWMRRVLEFVYTGTIRAALSEDLVLIFSPDEYAWTGEKISPTNEPGGAVTVIVSNTLNGAILVRGVDYDLDWRNNIDPTAAAKLIVTGIANYADTVIISNYLITAYCTKYFQNVDVANPVPYATTTNGALRGDAVVAAIDVPDGYCIDWQWPRQSGHDTNGVVYVFGQGGNGKEDILTLFVDYEKDENVPGGDDIPDKYQERVIFAVVNGWWNGERNGADKVGWVTLTNSVGQWAVNGTGLLSGVPGVGDKPFGMFEPGEANGRWNQDLSITIDRATFPIFLFSYGRAGSPVEDRGDKPFMDEMTMAKADSFAKLEDSIVITEFAVDGPSAVSGAAEAVVRDGASGSVLARTALGGRIVSVYGAESVEGPWEKISVQQTDAEGGWSVGRIRDNVYFKLTIEGEQTPISQ